MSLSIFMVLTFVPAPATGQRTPADDFQESLDAATATKSTTLPTPQPASILAGDWRLAIDETCEEGLPTEQKLAIFDAFWTTVDEQFAAFLGLDVDSSGLRARYRPEIGAGVSRGRFAAIMGQLSLALRESHTEAFDRVVSASVTGKPRTVTARKALVTRADGAEGDTKLEIHSVAQSPRHVECDSQKGFFTQRHQLLAMVFSGNRSEESKARSKLPCWRGYALASSRNCGSSRCIRSHSRRSAPASLGARGHINRK